MSEFEEVIGTATTDGEISTETTEQVEIGDTAQVEQGTAQETPQERQERLFKQSELDQILKDRLSKQEQRFETKLKSHPTLTYLEKKAQSRGMTVEQLIENDRKYDEQLEIQQRAQKDQVSYEYAERLYKLEQKEQQREQEAESIQQKEEQRQMYSEFLKEYPEFQDPQKANEIPPEVWQMVQKGEKLTNAFARYENQQLKAEMAKYQQQQQTQQANFNNAATSTGSVKDGGKGGEFISADEFEANRHDQSWVMKNYSKIQRSRAKW